MGMKIFRIMTVIALTFFLSSCGGKQQNAATDQTKAAAEVEKQEYANVSRLEGVTIETVQKEPKLSTNYDNIVLNPLQSSPQLASDYPEVSSQFQISVLAQLKDKKKYKRVESFESKEALSGLKGKTLIVDTKVTDMRIVSTGARIWAGAFAGASYMDIYVKLTDASTQKVVLEKIISSHNNAFASAWAPGTENALPIDMGKIVGEYFAAIVPAK
jgi:hypothetical protein